MRLINADALMYEMDKHFRHIGRAEEVRDMINAQPTIEPAANWIPCAERLPEDEDNFSPMGRYECTIQLPDGTRETFHLHRSDNGKWFYETGKGAEGIEGVHVVAWRHITDPYNPDHIPGTTKMMGGE